jgi:hypothetical protein
MVRFDQACLTSQVERVPELRPVLLAKAGTRSRDERVFASRANFLQQSAFMALVFTTPTPLTIV